jgi:D-3-phosphoglycerate dehydrogenase
VLIGAPNCIITSHIGSRTHESVNRQATRATKNLINFLKGDSDYIQANK